MNIGKCIKDFRKSKGLNQKDFSFEIGITQTYLSQIENGIKVPKFAILESVSTVFDIPIQVLIWKTLEKKDIPIEKQMYFELLKKTVDSFIDEFFVF